MTTTYPGIDYSFDEQTNRDLKTGIRYGIINQNNVLQAWSDSSEPEYPDPECECGKPINMDSEEYTCECGEEINPDFVNDMLEPLGWFVDDSEYKATSDSYGDIFVLESPYFTYAQFCSPCAPGACHLGNPLKDPIDNNKCYCFGHDWFDEGKAPYPVYSVKTGELINPR